MELNHSTFEHQVNLSVQETTEPNIVASKRPWLKPVVQRELLSDALGPSKTKTKADGPYSFS